jgi:hypothetical protein
MSFNIKIKVFHLLQGFELVVVPFSNIGFCTDCNIALPLPSFLVGNYFLSSRPALSNDHPEPYVLVA